MDHTPRAPKTPRSPKTPELVEVLPHSSGKPRPVRVIVDLAAAQDGVVEHDQLAELGFSDKWIEHRLDTGWLTGVFRGVYAVGHRRLTWRGRVRAAVLSCGPGAYASHHTAATLHGLWRRHGGLIHVTAPPAAARIARRASWFIASGTCGRSRRAMPTGSPPRPSRAPASTW